MNDEWWMESAPLKSNFWLVSTLTTWGPFCARPTPTCLVSFVACFTIYTERQTIHLCTYENATLYYYYQWFFIISLVESESMLHFDNHIKPYLTNINTNRTILNMINNIILYSNNVLINDLVSVSKIYHDFRFLVHF